MKNIAYREVADILILFMNNKERRHEHSRYKYRDMESPLDKSFQHQIKCRTTNM